MIRFFSRSKFEKSHPLDRWCGIITSIIQLCSIKLSFAITVTVNHGIWEWIVEGMISDQYRKRFSANCEKDDVREVSIEIKEAVIMIMRLTFIYNRIYNFHL